MTAGVSQHHTGVPELKKAYQEAVYAINQRLIDGWVKVYSYKGEMRPSNHFTKEARKKTANMCICFFRTVLTCMDSVIFLKWRIM